MPGLKARKNVFFDQLVLIPHGQQNPTFRYISTFFGLSSGIVKHSKTFLAVAPVSGPIMLERYAVEKQEDQNSTLVALHVGKLLGALAQNGSADRIPMQRDCHRLPSPWESPCTSGIFWHLLASSGIFWHLLASSGIFWHLLASSGIFWHLLALAFTCIHLKESLHNITTA